MFQSWRVVMGRADFGACSEASAAELHLPYGNDAAGEHGVPQRTLWCFCCLLFTRKLFL